LAKRGMGEFVTKATTVPSTAKVLLAEDVAAEDVHSLLDRIFEMNGCTGCGLIGLDLLIRVRDPRLTSQLQDINGVVDVGITSG
jgi:methylase of polypeptide subunit release factors